LPTRDPINLRGYAAAVGPFNENDPHEPIMSSVRTKSVGIRPMVIHIQPPLQLFNLLPTAILYRLADNKGLLFANGIILPGQMLDVHSLSQLYVSKVFISVRIINYGWSAWTVIFTRNNPFSLTEKQYDISLTSLNFTMNHPRDGLPKDTHLPPLDLTMSIKEFLVKLSCQLVLSNSTGQLLHYADQSNPDFYLPIASTLCVNRYIEGITSEINQNNNSKPVPQKQKSLYLDLISDPDAEDEEESQAITNKPEDFTSIDGLDNATILKAEPMADAANANKAMVVELQIYLPHDHCRKIKKLANLNWTLQDVFGSLRPYLSNIPSHTFVQEYIFFPYCATGKISKGNLQDLTNEDDNIISSAISLAAATAANDNLQKPTGGGKCQIVLLHHIPFFQHFRLGFYRC
jgi:hypothetical protein